VSHKGRSTGVKLETVAIRCNSLRRLGTPLLGQDCFFFASIVTFSASKLALTKRNRRDQFNE
jgi:hypothetical protein